MINWLRRRFLTPAIQEAVAPIQQQLSLTQQRLFEASQTIELYKEHGRHDRRDPLRAELTEAIALCGSGPAVKLGESQGLTKLKERFWDLELALEDRGWQRDIALSQIEFSRFGLNQLMLIARLYYIKNPLIRRGVTISSYYVFGRGFEIRCSNDESADEVLQEFLEDNEKELGHVGLTEKDRSLQCDGNLFFNLFVGKLDGKVQVRTLDSAEMAEIISDPDDASQPMYYRRSWISKQFNPATGTINYVNQECWYPDIDIQPDVKPQTIRSIPVQWDAPILHVKQGGLPKWSFGCPEFYAAIDWARAVREFLEDYATIHRALSRFAIDVEVKGGQQGLNAFQQAMSTTLMTGNLNNVETNPPAVTGATFAHGAGTKYQPIKGSGMTDSPEQCRRMVLMVAMAFGLPETFFGDASTGSLATAQSLDRPTELKFQERQQLWRAILKRLGKYALDQSSGAMKGKLREARIKKASVEPPSISIKFPAILEHDISQMMTAIMQGSTLGGFKPAGTIDLRTISRLVLSELGYEDIDEILDEMFPGDYSAEIIGNPAYAATPAPEPPPLEPGEVKPDMAAPKAQIAKEAELNIVIQRLIAVSERIARKKKGTGIKEAGDYHWVTIDGEHVLLGPKDSSASKNEPKVPST